MPVIFILFKLLGNGLQLPSLQQIGGNCSSTHMVKLQGFRKGSLRSLFWDLLNPHCWVLFYNIVFNHHIPLLLLPPCPPQLLMESFQSHFVYFRNHPINPNNNWMCCLDSSAISIVCRSCWELLRRVKYKHEKAFLRLSFTAGRLYGMYFYLTEKGEKHDYIP